jgi:tRNA 5-methylaminomethyl-2-thiouridine biosynthesis bifunctional protein
VIDCWRGSRARRPWLDVRFRGRAAAGQSGAGALGGTRALLDPRHRHGWVSPVFLAAWEAWRLDPRRCDRLDVIAIGASLLEPNSLPWAPSDAALQALLWEALPPPTPDLHRLAFDEGRIQLLIASDDAARTLRDIVASVDVFLLETSDNAVTLLSGEPRHAKAFARLAAPEATLTARSLDSTAEHALLDVGFCIDRGEPPASPSHRQMRFSPRFVPRRAASREAVRSGAASHALIVGGGLAGCATAWALAEHGWRSTLIERRDSIAAEASGNPAGLFHGIVNGQDGSHARFHRAAALEAHAAATCAIRRHRVAGALDGLLQLVDADTQVAAMRALLARLQLPGGYVQALDPCEASARAGVSLERPAWFYPGGGWIAPRGLARSFIERGGSCVEVRVNTPATALVRADGLWHLLDASGGRIASASVLVLAGSGESLRLIGGEWPVEPVRGQISIGRVDDWPDLRLPRLPLTGAGFVLPEIDGRVIFGATSDRGDANFDLRRGDDERNLRQLVRLMPSLGAPTLDHVDAFEGRAATRWVSRDRLPLIGAVPHSTDDAGEAARRTSSRPETPRLVPRQNGLYVFTALGSRGITWAALGAQVIAALVSGAPSPVGARLLDAIDPARFGVRQRQRQAR